MGAVLGFSCKPASPQKKYTAEARDKLVKAGGGGRKNNACNNIAFIIFQETSFRSYFLWGLLNFAVRQTIP